jgi:hypothetical protein
LRDKGLAAPSTHSQTEPGKFAIPEEAIALLRLDGVDLPLRQFLVLHVRTPTFESSSLGSTWEAPGNTLAATRGNGQPPETTESII